MGTMILSGSKVLYLLRSNPLIIIWIKLYYIVVASYRSTWWTSYRLSTEDDVKEMKKFVTFANIHISLNGIYIVGRLTGGPTLFVKIFLQCI